MDSRIPTKKRTPEQETEIRERRLRQKKNVGTTGSNVEERKIAANQIARRRHETSSESSDTPGGDSDWESVSNEEEAEEDKESERKDEVKSRAVLSELLSPAWVMSENRLLRAKGEILR